MYLMECLKVVMMVKHPVECLVQSSVVTKELRLVVERAELLEQCLEEQTAS